MGKPSGQALRKRRALRPAAAIPLAAIVVTFAVAIVAACAPAASLRSTRPIAKIALIAPFEGLYRQNGYAALDALRLAIAESPSANLDLLPLALDDSADPTRAARAVGKALADPETAAVVGPLTPETIAGASPAFAAVPVPWFAPLRIQPDDAFEAFASDAWAVSLVGAIVEAAQAQGAARLIVVRAAGWPDLSALAPGLPALPLLIVEDARTALEQVTSADAVLWLGAPHEGAIFLAQLRARAANATFWLGPQGGDPVFAEHADLSVPVFWAIWTDDLYNHASQAGRTLSPSAYLVYRAAQAAVAAAEDRQPASRHVWRVAFYRLAADGVSVAWALE